MTCHFDVTISYQAYVSCDTDTRTHTKKKKKNQCRCTLIHNLELTLPDAVIPTQSYFNQGSVDLWLFCCTVEAPLYSAVETWALIIRAADLARTAGRLTIVYRSNATTTTALTTQVLVFPVDTEMHRKWLSAVWPVFYSSTGNLTGTTVGKET